ncbi:MAG: YgfZ/GcvT domain-containing protein [Myxococcota bacterium]
MTMTDSRELEQLWASAYFALPRRSAVAVRGRDATGFLHRMSTQHLESLGPGDATLSCLINRQGRVVDVAHHIVLDHEHIALLGATGERRDIVAWLDSFLFAERVVLEDLTGKGAFALLAGGQAEAVLSRLELIPPAAPWAMTAGQGMHAVRTFSLGTSLRPVPSFLLWSADLESSKLEHRLVEAGARLACAERWETWRVAAGVPGEIETDGRANPLELALHDAIHWSKGCYIGQEVLARIDNYGKQARQLVSLRTDDPTGIVVGDDVFREGTLIGEVTSVSPWVWGTEPNLLALVRHKGDSVGVSFEVGAPRHCAVGSPRAAAQAPHD